MDGRLLGGRYRLLEARAMGGMASIWRATDEQTGEIVAVKRLHPHLIADPGARERLVREAAAMRAIRHPNVVGVRDAVVDGDEPALVMDFVEGKSLAELAADGRRFDETEALAIAAAVADGLAAAHVRGIVHRDVKPANVLIGDDGVVRLSDFGIAIGLEDATALTAADGVIGTLRYLAPERLAGEPATPVTDVWGLGTVLYEMLTGAIDGETTTVADRIKAASAPVPRPDGLTDPTWAVVARSRATDPRDRYADGGEMAAAIHHLPGVPPATVVPPDPAAPTEVVTLPAAVPAEPAVAAAIVAPGEVIRGPGAPEPSPEPRRPERTVPVRAPSRGAWAMGGLVATLALAAVVAIAAGSGAQGGTAPAAAATDAPTRAPSAQPIASAVPADATAAPKPGKGNGKGKGNGNGKDD